MRSRRKERERGERRRKTNSRSNFNPRKVSLSLVRRWVSQPASHYMCTAAAYVMEWCAGVEKGPALPTVYNFLLELVR